MDEQRKVKQELVEALEAAGIEPKAANGVAGRCVISR
jgi:hypothetical protein